MLSRRVLAAWSLSVFGGGVVAVALVAACSSFPDTNFGNPSGLSRARIPGEGGTEALICTGATDGGASADGGCQVSFARDIFPNFKEGLWGCGEAKKCHGGAAATPKIDMTSATTAYASLASYVIPNAPNPYLNPDGGSDPAKSSIECNLQSQCGQGMPEAPGKPPTHDELCVIDAWVRCGSPNN